MKLLSDDWQGVYVWVEDHDENIELSPHFDYEEDAIRWYHRMRQLLLKRLGMTVETVETASQGGETKHE